MRFPTHNVLFSLSQNKTKFFFHFIRSERLNWSRDVIYGPRKIIAFVTIGFVLMWTLGLIIMVAMV